VLNSLKLCGVGPAPELIVELSERLNVLTGDNGFGKSFVLDVAWWALTGTWAGIPALPSDPLHATIRSIVDGTEINSKYLPDQQEWEDRGLRNAAAGVVVYMRVDGGFSVWDPVRNSWRKDRSDRPAAYHFNNREVWDGLRVQGVSASEGLERDWVSWQKGRESQFALLEHALRSLSPPGMPLRPGPPKRVFLGEGFDRPTLIIGDETVPVAIASAGIRRILALAYLLVWAWHEHRMAAELIGDEPDSRLTLLIDEPETHLHPAWQRRVIPAIMEAVDVLRGQHSSSTQIVLATHSPLVLASLEPIFDADRDALFHLRVNHGQVEVDVESWAKQGDAANWLVSDVFGLQQARSADAESAIEAAEAFMRGEANLPDGLGTREEIDTQLKKLLPPHDRFWPRWIVYGDPTLQVAGGVSMP
jgi:putative AbiEii toxin of type IV toxin-antitoxin system